MTLLRNILNFGIGMARLSFPIFAILEWYYFVGLHVGLGSFFLVYVFRFRFVGTFSKSQSVFRDVILSACMRHCLTLATVTFFHWCAVLSSCI